MTPNGLFYSLKLKPGAVGGDIGEALEKAKIMGTERAWYWHEKLSKNHSEFTKEQLAISALGMWYTEVDRWLNKNASNFGYIYTKGVWDDDF